jgi:translocation and assembly module TamA
VRRTFRLLPLLLVPLAAPPAVPQTAPPGTPDSPPAGDTGTAAEEPAVLPYRVEIRPTGDDRLDAALAAVSRLVELQERAPTGALGILSRAEGDRERLPQALQSEGYWGGSARIEIGGVPLGSPELLERLERAGGARPQGDPLPVTIVVEPGPQYRIGSVSVTPDSPAGAEAVAAALARPLGVAPGDPARAGPILDAEQALKDRMLAAGYPLAGIANRETVVDHDRRSMEVAWRLAPGPLARFAPPEVEGMTQVEGEFLRRQASRLTNDLYSPERLERERKELMALGAFDSVRARAAERLDETGRLPVTFTFAERARHAIGASAAYETNYGPTVRLYWEHRNLFGRAERLRIEGEVARIGTGGSIDQMTYRAGIGYRAPGRFGRDLSLVVNLGALRERLDAYDRDAITGALLLERRFSERLTLQAGPVFDFGGIGPPDGGKLAPYQIAGVTFIGRYDGTDSLLDPGRGWRLNGTLTPSWSFRDSAPFAPLRLTASTYWDVLGDKRGILAVRGTVGSLLGGDRAEVPRHQRFYAGGGGSVRGYDYQSIGPRDDRNKPAGGASLLEASLEWRQRVWGDFGAVAFVDAGTVGTSTLPGFTDLRVGAGVGVRYFTAIGPIRADVAVPLVKQTGSSGYGLYVGIGQAF